MTLLSNQDRGTLVMREVPEVACHLLQRSVKSFHTQAAKMNRLEPVDVPVALKGQPEESLFCTALLGSEYSRSFHGLQFTLK